MPECKYLRPEDQTCRLEGGKADPGRCAGCRWKEEIDNELENRSRG